MAPWNVASMTKGFCCESHVVSTKHHKPIYKVAVLRVTCCQHRASQINLQACQKESEPHLHFQHRSTTGRQGLKHHHRHLHHRGGADAVISGRQQGSRGASSRGTSGRGASGRGASGSCASGEYASGRCASSSWALGCACSW